ncbi:MAG: phage head spike fiber domain-containing protein, partial [Minisyncoccia bacterium]
MNQPHKNKRKGFTLLEILLVIAAIGILAAIVLVAINPTRQIAQVRNAQRRSDINAIYKALEQYLIDNKDYPEGITGTPKAICNNTVTPDCVDLEVLVPTYLAAIPKDPNGGLYEVYINPSNNRIAVEAPEVELGQSIAVNIAPKDNIWNIAGIPSLDLNFASNKSLIDSVTGNNLITFARNSTATYVGADKLIKTAAVNEPRFDHNPITGESLGLLIEETRTNLVYESGDLTGWNKYNLTATPEVMSGPNGFTNYNKITLNTFTNSNAFIRLFIATNPSTLYTTSFYLKAGTCRYVILSMTAFNSNKYGAYFDLQTGIMYNNRSAVTFNSVDVGNGWYRLSVVVDSLTGGSARTVDIWPVTIPNPPIGGSNNIEPYYNSNGEYLYAWGAQVEEGTFPTSYIPTAGSVVARGADNVSIAGSNFSNIFSTSNTAGTMYGAINSPFSNATLFSLSAWPWRIRRDIVSIGNWTSAAIPSGSRSIGITNGEGANSIYTNGSLYNTNNNVTSTSNGTQLNIGNSDSIYTNGTISRLIYWPQKLSNTILQTITQINDALYSISENGLYGRRFVGYYNDTPTFFNTAVKHGDTN